MDGELKVLGAASPRRTMDEHFTSAIQLLAERHDLSLLEAWQTASKTRAFEQLRHESTGLYLESVEELYERFRQELEL